MSDRMPRKPVAVDTATAETIDQTVSNITKEDSKLKTRIDKFLETRNKSNVALHELACATLSHFAKHGNNNVINHLYKGLKRNDADALRLWAVKVSKRENADGTFSTFFRFSVKDGFTYVKGSKAIAEALPSYDVLLVGDTMFDIDQEKEIKEANADKLLATLAGLASRVNKALEKMEEGERARFPANLIEETSRLSRIASETKIPKPAATTH